MWWSLASEPTGIDAAYLDLNGIKLSLVSLEIAVSNGCYENGLLNIAISCRFKKKNFKAKQAASYHIEH